VCFVVSVVIALVIDLMKQQEKRRVSAELRCGPTLVVRLAVSREQETTGSFPNHRRDRNEKACFYIQQCAETREGVSVHANVVDEGDYLNVFLEHCWARNEERKLCYCSNLAELPERGPEGDLVDVCSNQNYGMFVVVSLCVADVRSVSLVLEMDHVEERLQNYPGEFLSE